jgi:hypothetical protein
MTGWSSWPCCPAAQNDPGYQTQRHRILGGTQCAATDFFTVLARCGPMAAEHSIRLCIGVNGDTPGGSWNTRKGDNLLRSSYDAGDGHQPDQRRPRDRRLRPAGSAVGPYAFDHTCHTPRAVAITIKRRRSSDGPLNSQAVARAKPSDRISSDLKSSMALYPRTAISRRYAPFGNRFRNPFISVREWQNQHAVSARPTEPRWG